MKTKEKLNNKQIASILNVSHVTVRNWIKAEIIPENADIFEIFTIKKRIKLGKIDRLKSRANKQNSDKMFVPVEYLDDKNFIKCVKETVNLCAEYFSNPYASVYNIALAYLSHNNELIFTGNIPGAGKFLFKRKALDQIVTGFGKACKFNHDIFEKILKIFESHQPLHLHDFLGICYQSLLSEGTKSQKGSYYTPGRIVNDIIDTLKNDIRSFLDPCCGTGSFLMCAASRKKLNIDQIYGIDIDPVAVFIAKINILFYYKNDDYIPGIFCADALNGLVKDGNGTKRDQLFSGIDAIATNPPWGANKNKKNCIELRKELKSSETFSMFILKSLEFLNNEGQACFLLPQSFLNIRNHQSIRKLICNETEINTIKNYGKAFTGVFTPVIFISFVKKQASQNHKLKIIDNDSFFLAEQSRFIKNYNNIFDINVSQRDLDIIKKIYSGNFLTLENKAQWSLGIVTGNNRKFVKAYPSSGYEPIYRGSDIENFKLKKAANFIKFTPENFQQVAKTNLFRAKEKLIYKFISSRLSFGYDNRQSLTLNSANVVIPDLPGYSVKSASALLNSNVFQFLFAKKISSFKVLRTDLEQFPFPVIDSNTNKNLSGLVDNIINDSISDKDLQQTIYKLFGLNKREIKHIENELKKRF